MERNGWVDRSTHRDSLDKEDQDDVDDVDDANDGDADASDDADDEPRTPVLRFDDDARGGDVRSAVAVHKGDTLRRRGLGEGGCGGNGDEGWDRAHGNGAKKADERYVVRVCVCDLIGRSPRVGGFRS